MKILLLVLHNLLFPFALAFMAPSALKKMRARGGKWGDFLQRFGWFSPEQQRALAALKNPLWIHAVSVGEVGVALKVARVLRAVNPSLDLVMTTTTPTGFAILKEYADFTHNKVVALYSAIDGWFIVRRFLKQIRPSRFVLLESELWPNLLHACESYQVPITLINARLSPRSERRYAKVKRVAQALFSPIDQLLVPEPEDIARWANIGVAKDRVIHTGSLKYDPGNMREPEQQIQHFRQILEQKLNWSPESPVLLAASTHDGEEILIAEVFQHLKTSEFADLKLILVPRHVERRQSIVESLQSMGLEPVLRSNIQSSSEVLVVDTTGELLAWQYLASLVIVGKSFTGEGGQNPAEAVFARKPVVFGPNMQNFEPLVKLLLTHQGAIQVLDQKELEEVCRALLKSKEKGEIMASFGHEALAKHQGAIDKTVAILLSKK